MPNDAQFEVHGQGASFKIDWPAAQAAAENFRANAKCAETLLVVLNSFSKPFECICNDGKRYFVKALRSGDHIGRPIFNDHVVGRIGARLSAPVGEVVLVEVSAEFINANPSLSYLVPCIAHGTKTISNVTDRIDSIDHIDFRPNRQRFAALSILYGLVGVIGDRQFIYGNGPEPYVNSVDHGHFFPSGPHWSIGSLASSPVAEPDRTLIDACALATDEIDAAMRQLDELTEQSIAEIVCGPPDGWGVDSADRVALVEFLCRRRSEMLRSVSRA